MKFTDNDIQDYLEGLYYGDIKSLEDYLQHTEEGKKRLEYFRSMFSILRDAPAPSLNISLEEKIMSALDAREDKKSFNWNKVLWMLTGGCIMAALVSCFLFLDDLSFFTRAAGSGTVSFILIAAILLSLAFHGIDWYRQYRRYNKWLT
jgi:hypothetical protein